MGHHAGHRLWFNPRSKLNSSSTSVKSQEKATLHCSLKASSCLYSFKLCSYITEALNRGRRLQVWNVKSQLSQNLRVRGVSMGQGWAPQEDDVKSGQKAKGRIPPVSPWGRHHPPRAFQAEVAISLYGLQRIYFFSPFLLPTAYFYRTSALTYLNTVFSYPSEYLLMIFL